MPLPFEGRSSVVGIDITGIGDVYGLKVNLGATPATDADLPHAIDGVPIRFAVVGPLRPR